MFLVWVDVTYPWDEDGFAVFVLSAEYGNDDSSSIHNTLVRLLTEHDYIEIRDDEGGVWPFQRETVRRICTVDMRAIVSDALEFLN